MGGEAISLDSLSLARLACEAMREKKCENPLVFDVRKVSTVTDYYVVASGASPPQLKAMFDEVLHALKSEGAACYRRCGDAETGWMILDYVDVVIHILSADARNYYAIEDLWGPPLPMEWRRRP